MKKFVYSVLAVAFSSSALLACASDVGSADKLRLGYFANLTHAPALVGVAEGFFADALGPNVELEVVTFSSGPEAIEAIFSGSVDASFVGPNPALSGYQKSEGAALQIVAGATSGGASLVVRDGIKTFEDLKGTTLATPGLGNTQDIALRSWLADVGLTSDTSAGGDVSIRPQDNADTLTSFIEGQIDGAWVPEPWATRLLFEGGGHELLNESALWPKGQFVTTQLVAHRQYIESYPENVTALISGLLDAIDWITQHAEDARQVTNDAIEAITTKRLSPETINAAWKKLTFTVDPIAASLRRVKENAVSVGFLDDFDLADIYNLELLNMVLAKRNLETVGDL